MGTGLMETAGRSLDVTLPGGASTRGFWTKRRRAATALTAIMALVAGIAVAYKLFEQEVPNNVVRDASNFDFTIAAQDLTAGETAWRAVALTGIDPNASIFCQNLSCDIGQDDVNMFPGDTRTSAVRITNANLAPARDASFNLHLSAIRVNSYCANGTEPVTGVACPVGSHQEVTGSPQGNQFLNFFRFSVDKQTYTTGPLPGCGDGDDCDENAAGSSSDAAACAPASLGSFTRLNPCKLGVVRAAGSETAAPAPLLGSTQASDDREYRLHVSEIDQGDQTQFKGWQVTFSLNFAARVPAEDEGSSRYSSTLYGVI